MYCIHIPSLDNCDFKAYCLDEIRFTEYVFSKEVIPVFVARSDELSQLADAMRQINHAALVYGKRRVGKTRLIKEALKLQKKTVRWKKR